jgi:hypothetical protein
VSEDAFERVVDEVAQGGANAPVWGQRGPARIGRPRGFNERRFAKRLREYWGVDADPMRVQLAQQDARFVASIVSMVGDELRLTPEQRRRVCAGAVRFRLLGESDPFMAPVDKARYRAFLDSWRAWLDVTA